MRNSFCLLWAAILFVTACKKDKDNVSANQVPVSPNGGNTNTVSAAPRIRSFRESKPNDTLRYKETFLTYDPKDTTRVLSYRTVTNSGETVDSAYFEYPTGQQSIIRHDFQPGCVTIDSFVLNSNRAVVGAYSRYANSSTIVVEQFNSYDVEGNLIRNHTITYGVNNFTLKQRTDYEWSGGNAITSLDSAKNSPTTYTYDLDQRMQIGARLADLTSFGGYAHTLLTKHLPLFLKCSYPSLNYEYQYTFDSRGRISSVTNIYNSSGMPPALYRIYYF